MSATVTVVSQVSAAPQESVTINLIRLFPITGVKQTVPFERVPLFTVFVAILLSESVAVNPLIQI